MMRKVVSVRETNDIELGAQLTFESRPQMSTTLACTQEYTIYDLEKTLHGEISQPRTRLWRLNRIEFGWFARKINIVKQKTRKRASV